jgi:hypothetical protein
MTEGKIFFQHFSKFVLQSEGDARKILVCEVVEHLHFFFLHGGGLSNVKNIKNVHFLLKKQRTTTLFSALPSRCQ